MKPCSILGHNETLQATLVFALVFVLAPRPSAPELFRYTRLRLEMGNAAQNFILAVWSGGGYATGMLVLAMLMRAGEVKADDFMYETNNGTITITRYTGSGGSVIIPATITSWPVTCIGVDAFGFSGLSNISIPDSITNIEGSAFEGCSNLTSVIIPGSVTGIGCYAFWSCTSLTNLMIGKGVTNIGGAAFSKCTQLAAITVDTLNSAFSSVDGVLVSSGKSALIAFPSGKGQTYSTLDSVTSIGDYAFWSCARLTNITIGNSVTNIGRQSFAECTGLVSATLGSNVATIGGLAFNDCSSLTSVSIPDSVSSIGSGLAPAGGAFGFCTALTKVTVGKSITNIGDYAFVFCHSLASLYFRGNSPNQGAQVFWSDNATVYYLPGTTGWGPTFGGLPAVLWNPQAQTGDASFGVRQNRFGFNITGTAGIPIVVEASADLAARLWVPLQSCMLTNGLIYFSDPQWANYASRFYRIRSP